jgi:aryl-alcohol dehydrogenase-like predicted oxidoreductase
MALIPHTQLDVFPLCLGGNVFGGTADEQQSFAVLDAFRAHGGNFVDTADVYSAWLPGNQGGESERVIGRWLKARGGRDKLIIATKVAKHAGFRGLSARNINAAVEASLGRLGTDYIDLYYAHEDDPSESFEETLGAFDKLVRAGKVRSIAASNFEPARLEAALATSERLGLARYVALQPHYNLVERAAYEGPLAEAVARHGLVCFPYFALARGFLTGKYRPGRTVESTRAASASSYLNPLGFRVLSALDEVAAQRGVSVSAVSLAWLRQQSTVLAPIASARVVEQVAALFEGANLVLDAQQLAQLNAASAPQG